MSLEGVYTAKRGQQLVLSNSDHVLRGYRDELLRFTDNGEVDLFLATITQNIFGYFEHVRPEDDRYIATNRMDGGRPLLGRFVGQRIGTCREINLTLAFVLDGLSVLSLVDIVRGFVNVNQFRGNGEDRRVREHLWVEYRKKRSSVVMVADATFPEVADRNAMYSSMFGFDGVLDAEVVKLRK